MRLRLIALSLFVAAALSFAFAEDFWVKKSWEQWNKNEVKKVLTDSPWAREYTMASVQIAAIGQTGTTRQTRSAPDGSLVPQGLSVGSDVAQSTDRGLETNVKTKYDVQLRSAQPVRQAVVRSSQIDMNYEKMEASAKQTFDANAKQYIDQQFGDVVVFHVGYGSSNPSWNQDMIRYWTTQTTDMLKTKVYLITPKNDRIPLSDFRLSKDQAFEFSFPRPKEQFNDGLLKLEFVHPDRVAGQKETRVLVEFKLAKMMYGGALVY